MKKCRHRCFGILEEAEANGLMHDQVRQLLQMCEPFTVDERPAGSAELGSMRAILGGSWGLVTICGLPRMSI